MNNFEPRAGVVSVSQAVYRRRHRGRGRRFQSSPPPAVVGGGGKVTRNSQQDSPVGRIRFPVSTRLGLRESVDRRGTVDDVFFQPGSPVSSAASSDPGTMRCLERFLRGTDMGVLGQIGRLTAR